MVEKLIDRNLNFLKKNISCDNDSIEIYRYALRIIYSYIFDVLVLMSLAVITHKVINTAIVLFTFAIMQVYGGGFHAKTQIKCFLITLCGWFIGMFGLQKIISFHWCIGIVAMLTFTILVFTFTPILNEKHPVSDEVYKKSKKYVRIFSVILDIVYIITYINHLKITSTSIITMMILYSISLIAALVKQKIISIRTESF